CKAALRCYKTPLRLFLFTTARQGHSDQPCSRIFNVVIFVLSRSGFHREQTAPVNIFEIAIGKSVPPLGIVREKTVDTQMPFGILCEPVATNKLILLLD